MSDKPVFDQRNQTVGYQYNAAGDMKFAAAADRADVVTQLEKLRGELDKASSGGAIGEEKATDADYQLTKAVQQARSGGKKESILSHLRSASVIIEDVAKTSTALSGLVMALGSAADAVQRFFH